MSSRPASNIREFAPAPASTVEDGDLDLLAAILSRTQSPAASRAAAADLIADFGGLADVAAADEAALLRAGLATAAVADLLRIRALAVAMARAEACHRPVLSSWTALTTYLRADMAHAPREQFRVLYLDRRNILMKDEGRADGPNNTILDNCAVYTAFAALDPLTQDKVSKMTGVVLETRTGRSGPAGFGAGRSSVSRSQTERPLLEPGEVRGLPDEEQIVFAAGVRPLRARKLRYDAVQPFRSRALAAAPDQAARLDTPGAPPHPWSGRRGFGEDASAVLPLFKEAAAAMDDRKAAAQMAEAYNEMFRGLAAQKAVLDHMQGGRDG
ncbi:type IV secretory system conjugative DNA transfer family protein [Brevundimonas pondensis]|uniref:Type IV secretory system conjugative DNA transfer family protein n=1 Tax=Brevundimonas pondensis TaxID=2774189 RepID=A0ABX7SN42_9CAUL|nr:type IV secretory system conjugative DNA transfer family protein [Brevundimonas pondensis]QTC88784.1 type IV secretory system conjugative DNA transfer family protein [Brevundimonas pondensis]